MKVPIRTLIAWTYYEPFNETLSSQCHGADNRRPAGGGAASGARALQWEGTDIAGRRDANATRRMMNLTKKKIAILTANDGVERVELTERWRALEAATAEVVHVTPDGGKVGTCDQTDPSEQGERRCLDQGLRSRAV